MPRTAAQLRRARLGFEIAAIRVQGSGIEFRVQAIGLRTQGLGFGVWG